MSGVVGTLLDLVEVDSGWEDAFEAAAGASLAAVVVSGSDAARAALSRLRQGEATGAVLALNQRWAGRARPPAFLGPQVRLPVFLLSALLLPALLAPLFLAPPFLAPPPGPPCRENRSGPTYTAAAVGTSPDSTACWTRCSPTPCARSVGGPVLSIWPWTVPTWSW